MDPKRLTQSITYYRLVVDALPIGDPVRQTRDGLVGVSVPEADAQAITTLDEYLLSEAVGGEVLPEVLQDDQAQPLDHWWWHLGALRGGTYPVHLLPEHLQSAFRAAA